VDIDKAVAEVIDQLRVVGFVEGFFKEGVTLLCLKVLFKHLSQNKGLQIVFKVGELLIES